MYRSGRLSLTPEAVIRKNHSKMQNKMPPPSGTPTIVKADFLKAAHRRAIGILLADYMQDPMGGGLRPLSPPKRRAMLRGLAELPTSIVLLAFIHRQPAGMAVCFRGFSTFSAAPLLNIHDLIVAKEYRGIGLGRRLLDKVEHVAQDLQCCKITLEVRRDNRIARRLYRSCGYSGGESPMEFWTGAPAVIARHKASLPRSH